MANNRFSQFINDQTVRTENIPETENFQIYSSSLRPLAQAFRTRDSWSERLTQTRLCRYQGSIHSFVLGM